jgi:hypothetical protein
VLILLPALAAWMEFLGFGLPRIPAVPQIYPSNFAGPDGFPFWVRYCHFFNFLFVTMLIRSGLSILVAHPRLYFNNNCSVGRFRPRRDDPLGRSQLQGDSNVQSAKRESDVAELTTCISIAGRTLNRQTENTFVRYAANEM